MIPLPGFGIDGLPNRAYDSQAFPRVASHEVIAQGMQRANGRRRGKECVDLVLVDNFPATAAVRIGGNALKHHRCGTVSQGSINNVGVSGYPANISGTPKHFSLAIVEYVFKGAGRLQQISARRVKHSFGFSSRARGVENEKWCLAVHGYRLEVSAGGTRARRVGNIPVGCPVNRCARALKHNHRVDRGTVRYRRVYIRFQGNFFATA